MRRYCIPKGTLLCGDLNGLAVQGTLKSLLQHHSSKASLSAIRVVLSAYLRFFIFLPTILISGCLHPAQHFAWYILHIS